MKIMFYVNTSTSDEVRKPQNCERSSPNFVSNINPFLTKGFLVLSGGYKMGTLARNVLSELERIN